MQNSLNRMHEHRYEGSFAKLYDRTRPRFAPAQPRRSGSAIGLSATDA
jgi:hypothetical protein